MEEELSTLTVEEAATYLKVKPKTVRELLRTGQLPGAKIGRAWRLRRADLDALWTRQGGGVE